MIYPQELIDEVAAKNDIVDIISQHVELKGRGGEYKGLCPFHNEKTPSFHVSQRKQLYHCFGCRASGNVYTFLQKYENFTFPEAIRYLADRANVTLPEIRDTPQMKQVRDKKKRLYEANNAAATFYYYRLRSPGGEIGMQYFQKRNLTKETMQHFGLGYAPQYSDALLRYLRKEGFEDHEIIEAGLAEHYEGRGTVDKFFNRVIFPIQDGQGKVIGIGGRVLGDGKPKYLNSPETPIFEKRKNLYGLNYARANRKERFILCEGYMDVIALHQAGFTEAVASLGTAFTPEQAMILKRMKPKEILLAYDSDGAGVNAAKKALAILRDVGLNGYVIDMRPHKDPDEFLSDPEYGPEAYEERIRNAENGFLYEIRMLRNEYHTDDPAQKTSFETEVARRLTTFEDELERENYLNAVAENYGIGKDALRKKVADEARIMEQRPQREEVGAALPRGERMSPAQEQSRFSQRLLLTWLSEEPQQYARVKRYLSWEDFTDPLYQRVAKEVFGGLEKNDLKPAMIINLFEDAEEQQQAAEVFHTTLDAILTDQEKEKALHDVVVGIKEDSLAAINENAGSFERFMEVQKILEKLKATDTL